MWVYTYIIPAYTYIPQTVFTYTVGVLGDCLREWVSGFPGLSQVRALVKLCTAGIANGEGRSRLASTKWSVALDLLKNTMVLAHFTYKTS